MISLINPAKHRYYMLFIEKDLFDTWCLLRSFGSTVSRRGRINYNSFDNEEDAWKLMYEIEYKKRQRGYIYSDMITFHPLTKIKTKKAKPFVHPLQQDLFLETN